MEVMNTLAQAGVGDQVADIAPGDEDFIRTDALAADLHRQYRTALKQQEKLTAENGADDPMAEIAQDLAESARSALDTRLIELRREQAAIDRARRQQLSEKEEQIRLRAKEKRETALALFSRMQMLERLRRQQAERNNDMTLLYMMLFFFLGIGPFRYVQPACSRSFNRLAA